MNPTAFPGRPGNANDAQTPYAQAMAGTEPGASAATSAAPIVKSELLYKPTDVMYFI